MKTIKLKSKLSEDEVLSKMKGISDALREKGVLAKGDELVAGIDEEGDSVIVTINGDIMDKAKYAELKKKFVEIGEVIANDLKNFDEEIEFDDSKVHDPTSSTEPEPKSEEPKSPEEKESKEAAVAEQAVKPAVETYHDTSELLITENLNKEKMDNLKTLLFSEEELKESKETPAVEEQKPEEVHHDETKPEEKPEEKKAEEAKPEEPKVEEPKSEEKKPEEKHFDEEKEVKFRVKCAKSGEVMKEGMLKVDAKLSDAESQAKVIEHLGGLKKDTVLEFFDDEAPVMTFDDLYFSQEEIENSPKAEEKPAEVEHHDEKPEEPKAEPEKPEEKSEEKLHDDMTPEVKAETLKSVAGYLRKAEQGKTLSVAEKYFCDSMTKYFTEKEVREAVEEIKKAEEMKPVEEEKVLVLKKEFDDMKSELEAKTAKVKELEEAAKKAAEAKPEEKQESREELIARMNMENGGKDLLSLAKERKVTK